MRVNQFVYSLFVCLNNFLDFFGFGIFRKTPRLLISNLIDDLRPRKTEMSLIRVGSKGDGGYLVPDDLVGIEAVYSPGVGADSSFELFFAEKGVPCFLLDGSVDGPIQKHKNFIFENKYLGIRNDVNTITFESWLEKESYSEQSLILQMDIEGSEWKILNHISDSILNKFRIVVVEFHNFSNRISFPDSYDSTRIVFDRLLHLFDILHIHANNNNASRRTRGIYIPDALEITFLNKNRIKNLIGYASIPHPLDRENTKKFSKTRVPASWTQPF